nr:hypothetical protein [Tanacetum cinerariifolium]
MYGSEKTEQQRHSRLVDEFDKFVVVEGESLSSVYERLTTLVNVMQRKKIHPLQIQSMPMIQDARVDIQSKNAGYAGNGKRNVGKTNINQIATAGNGWEQMLLVMKDEAGGNLNVEENNFMLDSHYGDDSLEELNAAVIMMERIQPENNNDDA